MTLEDNPVHHPPHSDDEHETYTHELAHWLATDPEAIPTIIEQLPDPRAVAFLKAIAPGIADMHRRLRLLEALQRARLTREALGEDTPAAD